MSISLGIGLGLINKSSKPELGPELMTNGSEFVDTTGWSVVAGTVAAISGEMFVNSSGTCYASTSFATVIGRTYRAAGEIISKNAGSFYGIRKSDDSSNSVNVVDVQANAIGSGLVDFVATATLTYINCQVNVSGEMTVDNMSVKEVL